MKYLELKVNTEAELIEEMLNQLVISGIDDAVIDNPLEIAEMVARLGDTEWYDKEQVEIKEHSVKADANHDASTAANHDACGDDKDDADALLATVTVYCTDDEEGRARAQCVRDIILQMQYAESQCDQSKDNELHRNRDDGQSQGAIELTETWRDDSEWKDAWKEYYHTARVSERFIVKPTWDNIPVDLRQVSIASGLNGFTRDKDVEAYEGDTELFVIEIDPGMAFGTGTHETTSLSLRLMEKYVNRGDKVLDVGTGSGILAIAAAKLGASEVLGIDIDEDAVRVANENIASNLKSQKISADESAVCDGDEESAACDSENESADANPNDSPCARAVVGDLTEGIDFMADVIVANLLAELVMKLTSSVSKHMSDGAVYITSGILIDKKERVTDCLNENNFEIIEILEDGEWCVIAAMHKGDHGDSTK
ncbi:MAG: 50S ribosomal protein L11 methyltransferase [Firmicutes bacterium]|nr:50S ribosomal protein L11 methyltransferase [Bacillota bacterium]